MSLGAFAFAEIISLSTELSVLLQRGASYKFH